ncbi:histidinol dehydrogenase [Streptomyces antimycoticus]|uniref:Histidinol dehydrogenase n=3 Tax=Streptomyces TaxID=1883 RepID=A0ABD5JDC1_9ACTN|nr:MULTISPECIES: histidinol dehydrogenase [Streptomyces]MEE4585249.1 histidinol dehydrogenase [Streptomyces sp. DSM 41602]KUL56722.1 histidinol dehydrogenase [Streptomyces violaceusniger]QTI89240.1 histidinol dehydrogenase [Streptomyces sp. AgN23]WJD97478.1 histidinol dehydrogenase [Streptomyces antimycoticus]WTA83793.1 histidinol dehydrogenase [Streptomyces antimycoticus]
MSAQHQTIKVPVAVKTSRTSRPEIVETVADVIADVRAHGDAAVRRWSQKFDGWSPESYRLGPDRIASVLSSVPETVLDDLRFAQKQIRGFAQAQRDSLTDFEVETLPGVFLGQRNIPISAAGAYVPGGRYPLTASAHMTVLTAKVAGVERVAATTPPDRGAPPPVSIAAMHLAGADEIYVMGGVQAVAALALGTETIDAVDMFAGPGNAYVAEAKRQLFGEVGIDLFAGPTEVLIVADDTADPFVVATDLLSQAEHGPDSPTVLITTSEEVGRRTIAWVDELLPDLPTGGVAGPAWRDHGEVIVVPTLDAAYALADEYASEHVQILTAEPREALHRMRNYGALFLGDKTCVAYGDKVIGTNHVLPTLGAARYTGGLWVGKYLKTVTYQEIRDAGSSARLGEICGRASRIENFEGHARSADVRAARYGSARLDWTDHTFEQS